MGRGSFVAIILLSCLGLTGAFAKQKVEYRPGHLIVKFANASNAVPQGLSRPMSSKAVKSIVANAIMAGSSVKREYDFKPGLSVVKLPAGSSVDNALSHFMNNPAVAYAEPDYAYELQFTEPNDLRYNEMWALSNTGQAGGSTLAQIHAPEAWDYIHDITTVVVAVTDTGLDVNHVDINDNVWMNPNELVPDPCDANAYDGLDSDNNGYIDDVKGWDFAGADGNDLYDGDSDVRDFMGHGTHVSGTIGAVGNNGIGIAGIAWKVQIMPLKIFADNSEYCYASDEIAAIGYAVREGANVINASWGGGSYSIGLYDAIHSARDANVIFVAAAGNDTSDNDLNSTYPANYDLDNIISVMATNNYDSPSYYTNYGLIEVDIAAPGGSTDSSEQGGILSTLPGNNYGFYQGTSMAAPHVTGAVALVMEINPTISYTNVIKLIKSSGDKLPVLTSLCDSGARLNLFNAVYRARAGNVINTHTPATVFHSIQDAIDDAATLTGDTLVVDHNFWYYENVDLGNKELTIRSGIATAGGMGNPALYPQDTVISAALDGTMPTLSIYGGQTSATKIQGFTIRDVDGGIYIDGTEPEISDCFIQDNISTDLGGGIQIDGGADPAITDCNIMANIAQSGGGGIYLLDSSVTITNSNIMDNNSIGGPGGGIYTATEDDASVITITDSNVINNISSADSGGGMYLFDTTVAITDCNISTNISHFDGGGIYWENSNGSISGTTIMDNVADYSGGGMYFWDSSPTVFNCLIARNSTIGGDESSGGAGLYLNGSTSNISSCTFADNAVAATDRFGGAIFLYYTTTAPTITDCIFSGNSNYAIYETVYTENGIPNVISPASVDFCLFGENLPADYWNADNGKAYDANFTGTYNIDQLAEVANSIGAVPLFATGRLGDYYLSQIAAGQLVDSPAVDAGSDTAVNLGLDTVSTRTDNESNDVNVVDIGFHYKDSTVIGTFTLIIVRTPNVGGTVTTDPDTMPTFKMYSQVQLTAVPASAYQLQSWRGTDNDAIDSNDNVVTMLSDKIVYVTFETKMIELRVIIDTQGDPSVASSTFTLNPNYDNVRTKSYYRDALVYITCVPGNASYRIEWSGTGKNGAPNDGSNNLTNWVQMDAPTGQKEEVRITFVKPRVLDVPGDYVHIQDAIDAALNKDTVVIGPGVYDIDESSNDNFYLTVSGKDITLTSRNPNDPCVVAATVIRTNYHVSYGAWVEDITARDYGTWVTSEPAYGMMRLYNVSRNMIIKGLTFQATVTSSTSVPSEDVTNDGRNGKPLVGGAIALVQDASPTIINCVFDNCTIRAGHGLPGRVAPGEGGWGGWAKGGALYCGTGSNPLVRYCSFLECSAKGGDGGNGTTSPAPGHGGSWDTWSEQDLGWYWGPYQPYWKYSGYGGAVFVDTGSAAEFQNCVFKDNDAMGGSCGVSGGIAGWPQRHFQIDAYGGAVYCAASSSPVFTSCQFIDNQLDPNGVGGTHNDNGSVVLDKTNSPYTWGGAVAFDDYASPAFKKCTFTHNSAGAGGAIYAEYADPLISDCTFTKNFGWDAGALYLVEGNYRISRSTFSQNEANGISGVGGGIVASDANLWVCDSKIQTNKATASGGGLYLFGSDTSWLMNCLITNNQAGRDGGGISANWYAEPNIMNCTIASNTVTGTNAVTKTKFASSFGGGLNMSYYCDANVVNTIIYNNSAANGRQVSLTDDFVDSETGEVYYNLPSYLRVKYSDIMGKTTAMLFDTGCKAFWGAGNIDADPKFVSGFYLSQPTGQTVTSPCVNKGTGTLSALHFTRHTTRTDLVVDTGVPDMGYHYIKYPDVLGDYNFDGAVNTTDLALWAFNNWMNRSCDFPYWCNGRDLNEDGIVNYTDRSLFDKNVGKTETLAPTPNPMKFANSPRRTTTTTATMTAYQAVDNSAGSIYYYFERLNANGGATGVHSPWQTSRTWTDTGLSSSLVYGYRVRAKDKNGNMTKWSTIAYITNSVNNDVTKPTPNPPTWVKRPYAVNNTSVSMTATTAKDASGVQYYFEETSNRAGGTDSGWISTPTYTDTGLSQGVTYTYRIRVRDRSVAHNATGYSTSASVKIVGAPSPNPPVWESAPRQYSSGINYYHTMTVAECTGGGTVEYLFECVYGNGISSGWQTSRTYTYLIANRSILAGYRVKARVRLPGGLTTAPSVIGLTQ